MIELQHIWKQFDSRVIFSDLSLNFQSGMVYALIGDSGCGKTTLLNILMGQRTLQIAEQWLSIKIFKWFYLTKKYTLRADRPSQILS